MLLVLVPRNNNDDSDEVLEFFKAQLFQTLSKILLVDQYYLAY